MNQSLHPVLAGPTWRACLHLGLVPMEMSGGLAPWQEQAAQSICPFNTPR